MHNANAGNAARSRIGILASFVLVEVPACPRNNDCGHNAHNVLIITAHSPRSSWGSLNVLSGPSKQLPGRRTTKDAGHRTQDQRVDTAWPVQFAFNVRIVLLILSVLIKTHTTFLELIFALEKVHLQAVETK